MTQAAMKALEANELSGCWRRIGVTGDRSCPALLDYVHCRNCPVHADAAQRSLQRPVEPEYRAVWARELARPHAPQDTRNAAALAFRIGAEWLAAPMAMVASVAPLARAHRLPHRGGNGALLGIVNVGGRLLPAVALGALLGIEGTGVDGAGTDPAPQDGRHAFARLLVLAAGGQSYALPVDEVRGVLRYAAASVRAPAATLQRMPSALLAGVIGAEGNDAAPGIGLLDGVLLEQGLRGLLR
jgi:chemotaxis-related protein WspD